MRCIVVKILVVWVSLLSVQTLAQMSSMGPGKGPAIPGTGKSKYTYPQPPKTKAVPLSAMKPGYQVPEHAEKYTWKLSSKVDGVQQGAATDNVPVYTFAGGRRAQVGYAKTGDEIVFEEIRPVGKVIYYKYAWTGGPPPQKAGLPPEYWVSGSNIEFAGQK